MEPINRDTHRANIIIQWIPAIRISLGEICSYNRYEHCTRYNGEYLYRDHRALIQWCSPNNNIIALIAIFVY